MHDDDTIVALSSGALPSGVAVIRLSGPSVSAVAKGLIGHVPEPRRAELVTLCDPSSGLVLDRGLALYFPGPASFNGEDCLELHCHGGLAVVEAVLAACSSFDCVRLAEAGEFSRRAFENGKLDLTQAEGLADLIAADTESQRRQALDQSAGRLRGKLEDWRDRIVRARAYTEAAFDFSEEDDVPDSLEGPVREIAQSLREEIETALQRASGGEIIRRGFHLVLMGPPNAGKSSLMNALAGRDIAIVTPQAGTTRDVVECALDIDGMKVRVSDTAGLRDDGGLIEREGMRRGRSAASAADLVVWLSPVDAPEPPPEGIDCVIVQSKADMAKEYPQDLAVNTVTADGLVPLIEMLRDRLKTHRPREGDAVFARKRQQELLATTLAHLDGALAPVAAELASEELRLAGVALGQLTGRIEPDHLLDVIFSEFCVGK